MASITGNAIAEVKKQRSNWGQNVNSGDGSRHGMLNFGVTKDGNGGEGGTLHLLVKNPGNVDFFGPQNGGFVPISCTGFKSHL